VTHFASLGVPLDDCSAASSPTLAQEDCAQLTLGMFLVSRTRTNFSDGTFCAAGPRGRNYLPTDLSYSHFSRLKTFYFWSVNCVFEIILLTYLRMEEWQRSVWLPIHYLH